MQNTETFTITKTTKGTLPRVPFLELKNAVLGNAYELSVAFVGTATSRTLNKKFRKKDYPTNVLSFPLSQKSGEIILCESVIKKEAPNFDMSYATFLKYLLIHGMLHLKGFDHGSTMESEERKFLKKFLLK